MVRTHNIEHRYYRELARQEKNFLRKMFLISESMKLKRYERILSEADYILAIARHEADYFREKYRPALFIPPFHRFGSVLSREGKGEYILLHGNLGVPDNIQAFLFLVKRILAQLPYPVVIAGKDPGRSFLKRLTDYPQIRVVPNPSDEHMESMISGAQVNLLYTFQDTGIKLKLLHALFAGRHCLVNPAMVTGTGLESLCMIAEQPSEFLSALELLMNKPFTAEQLREREQVLKDYTARYQAEKILRLSC